jgi:hypothetical protein
LSLVTFARLTRLALGGPNLLVALIEGLENLIDERGYFFGVGFFSCFSAKFAPVFSLVRIHCFLSVPGDRYRNYREQVPCHPAKLLMNGCKLRSADNFIIRPRNKKVCKSSLVRGQNIRATLRAKGFEAKEFDVLPRLPAARIFFSWGVYVRQTEIA